MRTFIDVGAHDGQTLEEVVKPRWGFDRIIAYEPLPEQFSTLVRRFGDDERVVLHNTALGDGKGVIVVYGSNDQMEASIYPTKNDLDAEVYRICAQADASAAVKALDGDLVMKLNCEGAEVPILLNLCASGAIHRLSNVMIDFDIRKVVGHEQDEQQVLDAMAEAKFDRFQLCEDVMVGATHQDRIAAWLDTIGVS